MCKYFQRKTNLTSCVINKCNRTEDDSLLYETGNVFTKVRSKL